MRPILQTCVAASKEYSLENNMNTMEEEWSGLVFETKEYRTSGTRILASVDETQQLLDDHIVKTQAMRGSRYPYHGEGVLKRANILYGYQHHLTIQDCFATWSGPRPCADEGAHTTKETKIQRR